MKVIFETDVKDYEIEVAVIPRVGETVTINIGRDCVEKIVETVSHDFTETWENVIEQTVYVHLKDKE